MQDVEEECNDVKRVTPTRGTGSKRSRAAEVHNLSERVSLVVTRTHFLLHMQNLAVFFFWFLHGLVLKFLQQRRRDRINEKMRALQELIPNCNKVGLSISLDLFFVTRYLFF